MFPQTVQLNEANIQKLTALYKEAYTQMAVEIQTATNFGVANRKALMHQIREILEDLGADMSEIMTKEVEKSYKLGAKQAADQLDKVGGDLPIAQGFNRIHKEAITALVDDTQLAFAESIKGMDRSARTVLSKAIKEQLTQEMAIGKVGGKTLPKIKALLTGILRDEGLYALIDKAGRKWSLDRYTEMLIRTKAVEARNRGLANRLAENGYDLVQVSSHGATDVCADWEGKILSTTGQTKGYPLVSDAERAGLFHPNCKHAINALVPELAQLTKAYLPDQDTMPGKEFYNKYYGKTNNK